MNLFLISGVVYKAANNKKELNKYEDLKSQITEKMETKLVIEENSSNDSEVHGVTKITNCLKKSIPKEELSDNLLNIGKQIEDAMNASNLNFAFKYKDLYTGFSLMLINLFLQLLLLKHLRLYTYMKKLKKVILI